MNDKTIEQEIQAKGLTPCRVTLADIEAEIVSEHYINAADAVFPEQDAPVHGGTYTNLRCLTICILILRNGCKVVGINHGPVNPADLNLDYSRQDARKQAIEQIWPLLGFRLRDALANKAERTEA